MTIASHWVARAFGGRYISKSAQHPRTPHHPLDETFAIWSEHPAPGTPREDRAAHALIPPLRLMKWSSGSESGLYAAAYRMAPRLEAVGSGSEFFCHYFLACAAASSSSCRRAPRNMLPSA